MLLGAVVVIIWNVGHHQLRLLHHVHGPRYLLLKQGLPLLLGHSDLPVLILDHGLLHLQVCLDLLYFLEVQLFSGQDLSLHLDVVHFLLLVQNERSSRGVDLGWVGAHLLQALHVHGVARMARVRKLLELVARWNVSVLLPAIQNAV